MTNHELDALKAEIISTRAAAIAGMQKELEVNRAIGQGNAVKLASVEANQHHMGLDLAEVKTTTKEIAAEMRTGFSAVGRDINALSSALNGNRKRVKRNTAGWTAIGGGVVAIVAGAVEMARRLLL